MNNERLEKLFSFLQANPDDPFVIYAIATEYVKLNDLEKAASYYADLMKRFPDYVGTYYHFGKLYEALNRLEEAKEIYELGMTAAKNAHDTHALSELQAVYQALTAADDDWN